MPRVAPAPKVDQTTPTGQAVTRARKMASKAGAVATARVSRTAKTEPGLVTPDELVEAGLAEFAEETTSNPAAPETEKVQGDDADDPFDGDGSQALSPASGATKKAVAKKAPVKKAAPPKKSASGGVVVAASDAWFADLDDTDEFINLLYYGLEGSTKTTSAATAANLAPEGSKILVVNAEGGLKIKALRKHGVDTSKIKIFPNPESDDKLDDESLERIYLRVQADLMNDPKSWYAVVFDSITDINQRLTDGAQEARVQRLLALPNKAQVDVNFVDRDDYGVSAKIIRKQLRRWRDLPCHFIVTALMRRDVDEDTNAVAYGPSVAPAVANDLLGYVDFAIMLRAADGTKPIRGLTKEGGKFRVKDRFEVLPKVMVEPTFDRIMEYFTDETTEANDAMQASLATQKAKASGTVVPEEDAQTE